MSRISIISAVFVVSLALPALIATAKEEAPAILRRMGVHEDCCRHAVSSALHVSRKGRTPFQRRKILAGPERRGDGGRDDHAGHPS